MAGVFLIGAVIFIMASLSALPLILVNPRAFNLYFFFASLFLQLALAFYFGPKEYAKSLITKENMIFSVMYFAYLGLNFYLITLESKDEIGFYLRN